MTPEALDALRKLNTEANDVWRDAIGISSCHEAHNVDMRRRAVQLLILQELRTISSHLWEVNEHLRSMRSLQ